MRTILTAGLIAAVSVFAVAAPAQASCFYNQSDITVAGVELDCGWFCSNKWSIRKGDHNCRGGKGGNFWVDALGNHNGYYAAGSVEDHGYVTITGSCAKGLRVQVWSDKHTLRRELSAPGPLGDCK